MEKCVEVEFRSFEVVDLMKSVIVWKSELHCREMSFSYKCVQKSVQPKDTWQIKDSTCAISVLHTVLALPSCNVGLQYYSLHFTQIAIKTIMVHSIHPFVNCFIQDILTHTIQQHSGACVANSTFEQSSFLHSVPISYCSWCFLMLMYT